MAAPCTGAFFVGLGGRLRSLTSVSSSTACHTCRDFAHGYDPFVEVHPKKSEIKQLKNVWLKKSEFKREKW